MTLDLELKPDRISECQFITHAEVAELADALRSGRSSITGVRVRLPPSAHKKPDYKVGFFDSYTFG